VWFSETIVITVLKSVARKHLVKTEDFYVRCDHNDNWSVWFNATVIVGCGVIRKWSIDPISDPKPR
jgi:hypothetical protein